jgi:hypothetical protein
MNLNFEMKTTDCTENTDDEDVMKQGFFIDWMRGSCLAVL